MNEDALKEDASLMELKRASKGAVLAAALAGLLAWSAPAAEPGPGEAARPAGPPAEKGAAVAEKPAAEKPAVTATAPAATSTTAAAPASADKTRETMEKIDKARETLDKWVKTRRLISDEQHEWVLGKEMLASRLDMIKREADSVEDKIRGDQATLNRKVDDRVALEMEVDQLKAVNAQVTKAITGFEDEIRKLYTLLPKPIQTKIEPLYKRVPEDSAKTRAPLIERFQNVVGILNEINKANSEITQTSEVLTLANGKPAEVRVVYVGLAQAYYLSATGEAGIGHPTPTGWKWEAVPGIARDVLTALEILQGKQKAEFVPLPVKIK
jgi:hypothetical protein